MAYITGLMTKITAQTNSGLHRPTNRSSRILWQLLAIAAIYLALLLGAVTLLPGPGHWPLKA